MVWEQLTVTTGGSVAGLAVAEADGCSLVFAATSGGIFRSTDAGRTWALAGSGAGVPFAEMVAPSPRFAHDHTLFACAGDTLFRSSDAAETWRRMLVGSRILSVASAPDGQIIVSTESDGVLRSDDVGQTWTGANAGLLDLTALTVAVSPAFEHDHVGFVGTASGLYRTRNSAKSWRVVDTGLTEPAVQCVALSPTFADDRLVLAGTEAEGLLVSDDAGTTWHRVLDEGVIAVAFSRNGTIAAATERGMAVSDDRGRTWAFGAPTPGTILCLVFVDDTLLAGLDRRGIARSEDYGASWEVANGGMSANVATALLLTPDDTVFMVDLVCGVRASTDGGRTWTARNTGLDDAAVLGLAVSPTYAQDRSLYAATSAGIHVSRDTGATWQLSSTAEGPTRAIVADATIIVAAFAGGRLLSSDVGAKTWRPLRTVFDDSEVVSLALSPEFASDRTLFAAVKTNATAELVLWRSVDGGERWQRWLSERENQSAHNLLPLAVSPNYRIDQLMFAGLGGGILKPLRSAREVRSGERRPLWRSLDLAPGAAVTAIAISPRFGEDRIVLAASNLGVFISRDAGDTFAPWSEGLSPPGVVALAISTARQVYALGLGGTLWTRSDL